MTELTGREKALIRSAMRAIDIPSNWDTGHDMWITRAGDRFQIRKMDNGHLLNSIRLVMRFARVQMLNLAWSMDYYAATTHAEMASYYAEQEANQMYTDASSDGEVYNFCMENIRKFKRLDAERQKRNLELLPL